MIIFSGIARLLGGVARPLDATASDVVARTLGSIARPLGLIVCVAGSTACSFPTSQSSSQSASQSSTQASTGSSAKPTAPVVTQTRTLLPKIPAKTCSVVAQKVVDEALSTQFAVVAVSTSSSSKTRTCLFRMGDSAYPQLTITATATTVTAAEFRTTLQPSGATVVTSLGSAAYRRTTTTSNGSVRTSEVGWLSAKRGYVTVTYAISANTQAESTLVETTTTLARTIERG